jgi:peptidyl-dipeptidase A
MKKIYAGLVGAFMGLQALAQTTPLQKKAQQFLDGYSKQYQQLYYASSLAQWQLNTHIVKGDTTAQHAADEAGKAFAAFTGSQANIDAVTRLLKQRKQLTPLQVRQLEVILFNAGANPETAGAAVAQKISAENKQVANLYGFPFNIDGKPITTGYVDSILSNSNNLEERRKAWEASKAVGSVLKQRLDTLRNLRNTTVQPLGYKDFFDYNAREYGLGSDEILKITRQFITQVWPLYRELHTWARYELAARYQQPVPDYLPAHWLPNRWGQDWTELVNVQALNIDNVLKAKGTEWMARKGEEFYSSLGFKPLPQTFWTKSSLYPLPANAGYAKNNHASAWHLDLANDIRSLQSITPTTEYWSTVLHEYGHIYYYQSYTNPKVPVVLRAGANRGYHEAFGTMIGLASLQKPFLEGLNLVPKGGNSNDTLKLLKEALDYIVHIPWGSGVMTEFEYRLYTQKLPIDQYNKTWWQLVKQFQGIVPPTERGEAFCDAATKTHINDDAAQYYDYSIANALVFQFHTYIAKNILHQDPHATNYWGNKQVGSFLKSVMEKGNSVDWRQLLQSTIHSDMSAQPMLDYFTPVLQYLKRVNAGRNYTLPATPQF